MADSVPDFVEIDGNPRPARLVGGFFRSSDGKRLRYALARPNRAARGTVLILQGRNETVEKYFETIRDLTARGYGVAIFDWRGQGGSERRLKNASKGYIDRIETYAGDLRTFIDTIVSRDCNPPYAILAHSMGGLVALSAVPHLVGRIERMVLSAPLVALVGHAPGRGALPVATRIFRWLGLGRVALSRVARSGTHQPIESNRLTGDPARAERNRRLVEAAPQLFVTSLTAAWLDACFREMRRLDDSDVIAGLHLPTLIVTAGADRVVDTPAAERLGWRMRSGHVLRLPGARHEILQERDRHRELFLAAFDGFLGSVMPVRDDTTPEKAVEAELVALKRIVSEEGEAALAR